MKKLIILKLGGSVITVKDNPFTPNHSNLERLANEIQNGVQKQNQLVIIHGAGSFGHIIVQKSGIDKGIKHPKQLNDFAVTQRIQNEWNAIVTKQLQDVNLPAIPCQVSSHVILKQGRIDTINLTAIEGMIKIGLIPVLYGVPAYDIVDGCRILSGDQIASYIAKELQAEKIIHGTNVDGVLSGNPKNLNSKLIREITLENIDEVMINLKKHSKDDVTGQMYGKIFELMGLAKLGIKSEIINANKAKNIENALLGTEGLGTTIKI